MMKKMYDEGDDEMKRTIAKAWTEVRKDFWLRQSPKIICVASFFPLLLKSLLCRARTRKTLECPVSNSVQK